MADLMNRLIRYRSFIDQRFVDSLTRNKEYSLSLVSDELRRKLESGTFKTLVFTGMGCSAIVSDLIRGFFRAEGVPVDVLVVNDYDFESFLLSGLAGDETTLFVVSSYSGHSEEPIRAYERMRLLNSNIVFLTSGGRLKEIGIRDGVSIILWQLVSPDREYPLLHVPQYFSILLDALCELGLLGSNYQDELRKTGGRLRSSFDQERLAQARRIAEEIATGETILLATPRWHESLLKIVKMHLNEIAMVPAHANSFHEFCHSEVAVFGRRSERRNVILFKDADEDDYTLAKMDNLKKLLAEGGDINPPCVVEVELQGLSFIERLFDGLLFASHLTYFLGIHHNVPSRDLISRAAGNPWYSSHAILREQGIDQGRYDVAL